MKKSSSSFLFFSGGTALSEIAAEFARKKIPSTHIVTTFDSGGSSGVLRKAFAMPAVGDIRSRLISLADVTSSAACEECSVLRFRLSQNEHRARQDFFSLLDKTGKQPPIVLGKSSPVRQSLTSIARQLHSSFTFAGTNLGNLILAQQYLEHGRSLAPAIDFVASLVHAQGKVLAASDSSLHLVVRLENGKILVGQHRFTGKFLPPVTSAITDLWLAKNQEDTSPVMTHAAKPVLNAIKEASCICFPVGSFYSSVLANLLPSGVCQAIMESNSPKVFIPNTEADPELFGLSLAGQLEKLIEYTGEGGLTDLFLDQHHTYPGGVPHSWLKERGITVHFLPLLEEDSCHVSAQVVAAALQARALSA